MRFAIHTAAILIVLLIAGALLSWSSWSRFKIDCDLTDIARDIRRSALALKDKEQLLDEIEAIEDRIDTGATVSLYQWLRSARAVRDMLRIGVTPENARLIERELRRVESRLVEPEAASAGESAHRS
jgi:hypothetical protein